MKPGVSVVIPVYNGARYLGDAVASVAAQTHRADAIIIVDDGSTDPVARVVCVPEQSIRYLRQDHAGASAARNAGAALVETEFLAFLDADDLWLPEKLAWQLAACAGGEPAVMVFGQIEQFASPDLSAAEAASLVFARAAMPGIAASVLLMRTGEFRRVGGFDTSLETGEFIEWYARAGQGGIRSLILPQTVARRRLHRSNHGRSADPTQYARAMKAVLDNRRKRT